MAAKRLSRKNRLLTPGSETTVAINYSEASRTLEVEFKGGVYHYLNVEPEVWEEYRSIVESGGSSGRFVNFQIKPFYETVQVG
jgi:hypothetical protein